MNQKTITIRVDDKTEGQLNAVFDYLNLADLGVEFTPSDKLRAALALAVGFIERAEK